jgi:hypothetical protein
MVRYRPWNHDTKTEWVYNRADIENARIVWARELPDEESNRRLISHFANRTVWLALPDAQPARIEKFPVSRTTDTSAQPYREAR